jgi:hypothetical protein
MNATILKIFLLAFAVSAFACNNPRKYTLKPGEQTSLPLDSVLVRADRAKRNMAFYDALVNKVFHEIPIESFTIRAQDLLAAMGLSNSLLPAAPYKYVRVYLGYDSVKTEQRPAGFRLYIVPVVDANLDHGANIGGRDLMMDSTGHALINTTSKKLSEETEYVLDLNAPCPRTCPELDGLSKKIFKQP